MEAKMKRYRELKNELRSLMNENPQTRELVKCVLGMNELLVEALLAVSRNQENHKKLNKVIPNMRARIKRLEDAVNGE